MDKIDLSPELSNNLFSDQPEKDFTQGISKEKSRKFGQYFTPYPVAKFMARWVNQAKSLQRVLDPAVGLGVFFRALLDVNPGFHGTFYGYEIDLDAHEKIIDLFKKTPSVKAFFLKENFLSAEEAGKYDGILCNPPYIRYKRIINRDILIQKIETACGISINPQSNIYTYFIILGALALSPNGRAAFLVPSEFLNSEFGIPIKEWLMSNNLLKKVAVFDSQSSIFSDAITTSCLLFLENNRQEEPIIFSQLGLQEESPDLFESPPLSQASINPAHKWTVHVNHKELAVSSKRLIPLSTIAHASRGIASGDNRFFTFNRLKTEQYGIPTACLLPCLTRASQARLEFFTQSHFDMLIQADQPVFLMDANRDLDDLSVRTYLEFGRRNGSHNRFLTRNRDPWYRLERRPPAPILAATFSRQQLRFVRNEAGVYNLTCFHSIYLNPVFESKTDLLMAYLLTPFARGIISRNRREYGNGLIKYEPNDLNTALIADLTQVEPSFESEVLSLYRDFRQSRLFNDPDLTLLDRIDALFTRLAAG